MGRKNKSKQPQAGQDTGKQPEASQETSNSGRRPVLQYSLLGGIVLAVVVVAALVLAQQGGGNTVAAPTTSAAGSGAEFAGIVGNAEDLDLATSYRGKVVVVNYMAGWCKSCWGEIPGFIEVHNEYKDRGVTVVGISLQTSREQTQVMIDRLGIPYPVYEDLEGYTASNRFRLKAMPTTFIFNDGQLTSRLDGPVSAQALRSYVEDAL